MNDPTFSQAFDARKSRQSNCVRHATTRPFFNEWRGERGSLILVIWHARKVVRGFRSSSRGKESAVAEKEEEEEEKEEKEEEEEEEEKEQEEEEMDKQKFS
jgi:hypothetical protein